MASISKRASGAWQNTSYGIRGTAIDTITTLPTTIYGDGTNATISIKGNTTQSSTPTPDNPVMPQGTGDKTVNLFDINATPTKYNPSTTVTVDGRTLTITGAWYIYYEIDVAPNTDYYVDWTIDYTEIQGRGTIAILTTSGQAITQQSVQPFSFNSGENQRIRLYIYSGNNEPATVIISNIMFNTGSTAKPYEPFGVKIPISSASITTPVYLGEVQTTRRVKKLVLDGTENWVETAGAYFDIYVDNIVAWSECICTHCKFGDIIGNNTGVRLWVKKAAFTEYSTITDFKAFLAAQYAAGTPVTVWYVLTEPTTGIVNESLMKIEDYADEVNNISIPTTDGANALSVNTTVQPSEVSVNYHGWHMGTVHERTAGQWD